MTVPDQDSVVILIANRLFGAWPSVDIHRQLDSFSSIEFTAPFEADRKEFRDTFRPFSFKSVEVRVATILGATPETIFKGTMIGINPEADPNKSVVSVTAYALPAVLNDVNAPASAMPIEFAGLSLKEISKHLAALFALDVEFGNDDGPIFDKAKLDIDRGLFDFLTELSGQRNLVITDTPDGKLLFWQSIAAGNPVARLKEGEQPVTAVRATFDPQNYFSEVTGFATARKGRKGKSARKGSKFTEQNPRLTTTLRPMSFNVNDADDAGVPEATKAKLGRMLANSSSYQVDVGTWRDPAGNLWEPNTTITLLAPDAMIYGESEFLIRSVSLHQDKDNSSATLGLVLPGAFSGTIPDSYPWDE